MRKPIIIGNWKMNKLQSEAKELAKELIPLVQSSVADCAVCVPYTNLEAVKEILANTKIGVGAENAHWAESGAFTGEISAAMLEEIGISYCIVGHSERRQYFGETDETVNMRTASVIKHNMTAVVCVGELLEERELGKTEAVLTKQITEGLKNFTAEDFKKIIVAYEPVWAIGTGKTATAEDANATILFIRNTVKELFGEDVSSELRILYGGSMNTKNVDELMSMPEIDGGLIGGASLKAADFARIVNYR